MAVNVCDPYFVSLLMYKKIDRFLNQLYKNKKTQYLSFAPEFTVKSLQHKTCQWSSLRSMLL